MASSIGTSREPGVSTISNNDKTDAPITSVLVYPDRARISRVWTKRLLPGIHHVRLTNFQQQYFSDSLRVDVIGPARISQVLETAIGGNRSLDPREKLEDYVREQTKAQVQVTFLERRLETWEAYRQVVMGNAASPPSGVFKEGAFADLHDFLWKYEGEFIRLHAALVQAKAELARTEETVRRHRSGAGPPFNKLSDIAVVLEVDTSGEVSLNMSYQLPEATWTSSYDLRLKSDQKQAEVTCFAHVAQWTTEEWSNVTLSVATHHNARKIASKLDAAKYSLQIIPLHSKMDAVASSTIPSAFTFDLAAKVSLSPDKELQAVLRTLELDSTSSYHCEPSRDLKVYRTDHLINNTSFSILSGPAAIYRDGNFLGKIHLADTAPLEEIPITLGADANVQLTVKPPTKVTKPLTSNLSESKCRVEAEYSQEYEMKNARTNAVSVTLETYFPTCTDPRFKITPVHPSVSPSLAKSVNNTLQVLRHVAKQTVEVPASSTRAVRTIYKVDYPHNLPFSTRFVQL